MILDTFATYYNLTTGTKWQCLLPPDFLELFVALNAAAPSAWNVYFELVPRAGATSRRRAEPGSG